MSFLKNPKFFGLASPTMTDQYLKLVHFVFNLRIFRFIIFKFLKIFGINCFVLET